MLAFLNDAFLASRKCRYCRICLAGTLGQRAAAEAISVKAAAVPIATPLTTAAAPLQHASVLSTGPAIKKLRAENNAPEAATPVGGGATALRKVSGSTCSAVAAKLKGMGSAAGNSGPKSWAAGSAVQVNVQSKGCLGMLAWVNYDTCSCQSCINYLSCLLNI